jgi:hypothetical protein
LREVGRLVGGKGWKERVYKRGMEAAENGKESSHSAHASGINEYQNYRTESHTLRFRVTCSS